MSERPKLLYCSGPMTGKPEFNYPTFNKVAATLRAKGYEVINPAETAGGTTRLSRATFLRIDIGYVMAADAIVLLPGWSDSQGATLEVMVAHSLGLPIYLYSPSQKDIGVELTIEGASIRASIPGGQNGTQPGPQEPVVAKILKVNNNMLSVVGWSHDLDMEDGETAEFTLVPSGGCAV